jgi:hypothetical protein
MSKDTDNARIAEANNLVANAYPSLPAGSDPQAANDRALARRALNTEILGVKGTPTNR